MAEYRDAPVSSAHPYAMFGPWGCPVCGGFSWQPYRCDNPVSKSGGMCGADLVEKGTGQVQPAPVEASETGGQAALNEFE